MRELCSTFADAFQRAKRLGPDCSSLHGEHPVRKLTLMLIEQLQRRSGAAGSQIAGGS